MKVEQAVLNLGLIDASQHMGITRIQSYEQNHSSCLSFELTVHLPFPGIQQVALSNEAPLLRQWSQSKLSSYLCRGLKTGNLCPKHGKAPLVSFQSEEGEGKQRKETGAPSKTGYFKRGAGVVEEMSHWGMWTLPYPRSNYILQVPVSNIFRS